MISVLSAVFAYTEKTSGADWLLYDYAMQFSQLPIPDDLLVIDIDDKSISELGRWPWPRKRHADLLTILNTAGSKTVVFDVLFPDLDTENGESDQLFAQAIQQHGSVILPIYLESLGLQAHVIESPPHALFYQQVLALGHVHLPAESDGVIRGVFLKEGVDTAYWPHLSLSLLDSIEPITPEGDTRVIPGVRANAAESSQAGMSIARDFYNLLPMPAAQQGLRHYSYSDILNGSVALTNLHQKIIFVGATAAGLGDVLTTPVGSMNGVELNAWAFQALRHQQMIQVLPLTTVGMITFLLVLCGVGMLGRLSPRLFLFCSILSVLSILLVSTLLLLVKHVWFPPIASVAGIVMFFPLWSWLRAESILRFLRKEIETLSQVHHQETQDVNRQASAQHFLEKVGVFDSHTMLPSFWAEQLAKYTVDAASSQRRHTGVEVVARTIAQLNMIKENDRRNRQLIEKSLSRLQDAVCIADVCGEVTFTNKQFKQWFQVESQGTALLESLAILELKSGMTWAQFFSGLYQTQTLCTDEAVLKAKTEQVFLCQASLVSINEAYNDTLIITFTEITQLKAAENARSEALSFLSHDLRSPMVSVLSILEQYHAENSVTRQSLSNDALLHIERLVRKNLDYAESFLQLSKADALLDTTMSPCDMHAVLDSAHVYALALAAPKAINVVVERCNEDVWVQGDLALLERALNNLISNAIKFSPAGSNLSLRLSKHQQEAQLSVKDQGAGIDEKDQNTIFERFTRLPKTASAEGAGLGLSFVATVAKKHQGHVSLESKMNKGATFTLHLPSLDEHEIFDV